MGNFPFPTEFMLGFREYFFHFMDFSGTDIYHSDIKMRVCTVEKIFFNR